MTNDAKKSPEVGEKGVENAIKLSLMERLLEKPKKFFEAVGSDEKIKEKFDKEKERMARDAVLAVLIVCEVIPGLEMANEGAKWVDMAKKVTKAAPGVRKAGSIPGVIKELYPDMPEWLVASTALLDTVGVPYIGVVPDVIQLLVDQKASMSRQASMVKDTFVIAKDVFFEKSDYEKAKIDAAKLVFKGEEKK